MYTTEYRSPSKNLIKSNDVYIYIYIERLSCGRLLYAYNYRDYSRGKHKTDFLWWTWVWEEVQRNAKELQWNESVYRHAFPCRQPLFRGNLKHKKQPGSTKEFRRLAIMFTLLQHRTYRAHSMMTDMRCFSGDLPNIRSWNKCNTRNYKSFWALRRKTLAQSTWHNWFECIHIP